MTPAIANIATLIGDSARAKMLIALLGGKALTATELEIEADVSTSTASSHLQKLVAGGLLLERKQGRHKYFQLQHHDVANLLEMLLNISQRREIATGPQNPDLRQSRVCYDHLAGTLAVKLYDALSRQNLLLDCQQSAALTAQGALFFAKLGFAPSHQSTRPICKACLDWSERRSHLAGQLGQWILQDIFAKEWAQQDLDSRVVRFSAVGLKHFSKRYGIHI